MVLMESYLFCGSVRLGVILISAFALAKSILIVYVLSTHGIGFMLSIISTFDINMSNRASYYMVRDAVFWLEKYRKTALVFLQLISNIHIICCLLAAYGAYKLKRFCVIPLAFLEFIYLVEIVAIVILFLRILRHFISLGNLILLTLSATAYAFLVAYDFIALVAFEQIVRLVKSKRYQQIYGSDPLNPIINTPPIDAVSSNENGFNKHNHNVIHIMPMLDKKLWWQIESLEKSTLTKNSFVDDAHKYFQHNELLSDELLRNAINIGYSANQRF